MVLAKENSKGVVSNSPFITILDPSLVLAPLTTHLFFPAHVPLMFLQLTTTISNTRLRLVTFGQTCFQNSDSCAFRAASDSKGTELHQTMSSGGITDSKWQNYITLSHLDARSTQKEQKLYHRYEQPFANLPLIAAALRWNLCLKKIPTAFVIDRWAKN